MRVPRGVIVAQVDIKEKPNIKGGYVNEMV
jgi:hypothetical protein